jgi:microsomal dipeptidase-like Zn-dependent dipeptidase
MVPELKSLVPAADLRPIPFPGQCRKDVPAMSMEEALNVDAPTHGDPRMSPGCGDSLRHTLIGGMELFKGLAPPGNRHGAPFFDKWPRWNDFTHQKMWFEWIERARAGGLRVMVALSHNSRTLGDAVGPGGPISGVTDDMRSSDLQIEAIKQFVAAHPDMMELALSAAHVHDIVQRNHIAVVLGVEIDHIGNFKGGVTDAQIQGEIQRLYNQGVRYIFPVHLTDNLFGGTAIYDAQFNWANFRENGRFWDVECASQADQIGMQLKGGANYDSVLVAHLRALKLGINPTTYPPPTPACQFGHRNAFGKATPTSSEGMTNAGRFALREMMKRGMIIDIDHMDQYAVEDALRIAEAVPAGGYPLVSGHNGIRNPSDPHANSERMITRAQLARLACLRGMLGLGTAGVDAWDWAQQYVDAFNEMGKPTALCSDKSWLGLGRVALGTDANSLVPTPAPPRNRRPIQYTATFQPSRSGTKTWDYNVDGVAHYGMFADFVQDVRAANNNPGMSGPDLVDNHLMRSADYFWRMWQRIETQRSNVR